MHKSSYNRMSWFKNMYLNDFDTLNILDVGSLDDTGSNFNYKSIFNKSNWNYVGLDFNGGNNVDLLVRNIYHWDEINDNSYDVVICGQLLEHLAFFWIIMSEINRVLKSGGFCCIIAPSSGPKHGSITFDGYRFTGDGMKALAESVDFDVLYYSTNENEDSKPWHDSCLIARKKGHLLHDDEEINIKIKNIEEKLDNLDELI